MNMHCIPDNLGEIFPDLEYLDLSNNKIKTWNRPFANFTKLKNLSLNGNKISTIHDSSFPTSWMTAYGTLKRLKLRDNPFVKWSVPGFNFIIRKVKVFQIRKYSTKIIRNVMHMHIMENERF
jgi:hypothetical protein